MTLGGQEINKGYGVLREFNNMPDRMIVATRVSGAWIILGTARLDYAKDIPERPMPAKLSYWLSLAKKSRFPA